MYLDNSIKKYLDDLAAKMPAPGGGSAAALTGALAVSLMEMVLNYTVGKDKYREFEPELSQALKLSQELKQKLSVLIDKDVEAYQKLSAVLNSQDNIAKEKALKDAAGVPMEICNYSYEAMKLCRSIMDKTNKNLITDIGVAAALLEAAYESALFNININLKGIKDKEFNSRIKKVIAPQAKEMAKIKQTIIKFVNAEL
ncbi:MAG: cyclodeaminase/cyclohydrolase family protein [Candidatus Omnitrophica bacterium]|nr:cyclodeaminase/cyclohydrolase family protein [Candidatus Omnitrophota bacterium]MDD5351885.1 cyclodeaminase/cyclohydrolase family protein [Candidatus Omnitrophota bacterium]MDD5550711.1 cyclodeaminase/cyclohydrolase family protein [Candidatus Omnitrophota bacterium]